MMRRLADRQADHPLHAGGGCAAAGHGGLIAVAVDRHFEELDRDTLQDKIHLVSEIIARSDSAADRRAGWTTRCGTTPACSCA